MRSGWILGLVMVVGACANDPEAGDPCTVDDDCAPDLVCHLEPEADEGVCDACHHDDEDCHTESE